MKRSRSNVVFNPIALNTGKLLRPSAWFFVALILCCSCSEKKRLPVCYLIPEGFVGWVHIEYSARAAPPLSTADGCRQVGIDKSGIAVTSSGLVTGWAADSFYYVSGDHKRKLRLAISSNDAAEIWNLETISENDRIYELFFVGSRSEYLSSKHPEGLPKDSEFWNKM